MKQIKVLCLSPYIYDEAHPEFLRNKTGFGMMVRTICAYLGALDEVALLTSAITPGYPRGSGGNAYTVLSHRWSDVLRNIRPRDIRKAVRMFFAYPQGLKMRLHYVYYALNRGSVRAAIRTYKPDVVHIHGTGMASRVFFETCREMEVPIAVTLHGVNGLCDAVEVVRWEKEWEKELLQEAEREHIPVSIVGTGGKRAVCEAYGLSGENITPIPNCADMEKKPVAVDVRKLWKIPPENRVITVVGNISVNKNQVQVAQAYGLLPEPLRQSTTILFLGTEADGGALAREIQRQGAGAHLIACGFISRNCLESYYREASLTVLASYTDGFGISVAEGFQYGVPAVLFDDLDAVPDMASEAAVITVKERSTQALAAAIQAALEKSWDAAAIREHGKNFSPELMAERYDKLLRSARNQKKEREAE